MTPKSAIMAECRYCMNTSSFRGCPSDTCKLNDMSVPYIKRIKAHCLDCCPQQSIFGVKACDGKLINGGKCPLHPFRMGKNPKRISAGLKISEKHGSKEALERLKSFHFPKRVHTLPISKQEGKTCD